MGYESRLYIVRKTDIPAWKDKKEKFNYAETMATYEMGVFPPFQILFNKDGEQALMGQLPQYHGTSIKSRYFGKVGNTDRNDTGNPFVDIPLRTRRDVWTIASEPSREGHFAMYPQRLVLQCLLCGCPEDGVVLDPFLGSGTTVIVARKNNRHFVGCELNPEYVKMARRRLGEIDPLFEEQ